MMLLCRTLDPQRAYNIGLVNEVVPTGQQVAGRAEDGARNDRVLAAGAEDVKAVCDGNRSGAGTLRTIRPGPARASRGQGKRRRRRGRRGGEGKAQGGVQGTLGYREAISAKPIAAAQLRLIFIALRRAFRPVLGAGLRITDRLGQHLPQLGLALRGFARGRCLPVCHVLHVGMMEANLNPFGSRHPINQDILGGTARICHPVRDTSSTANVNHFIKRTPEPTYRPPSRTSPAHPGPVCWSRLNPTSLVRTSLMGRTAGIVLFAGASAPIALAGGATLVGRD